MKEKWQKPSRFPTWIFIWDVTLRKIWLYVGVLFIAVARWIIQQMILMTKKLAFATWQCQWRNQNWTSTHQQSAHLICHLYDYRFIANVLKVPLEINLICNVKPNHKNTIKQIILIHVHFTNRHWYSQCSNSYEGLYSMALQKLYVKRRNIGTFAWCRVIDDIENSS